MGIEVHSLTIHSLTIDGDDSVATMVFWTEAEVFDRLREEFPGHDDTPEDDLMQAIIDEEGVSPYSDVHTLHVPPEQAAREVLTRFDAWAKARAALSQQDVDPMDPPSSSEWENSDDEGTELARELAWRLRQILRDGPDSAGASIKGESTSSHEPCEMTHDGTDLNGDVWNSCRVHNHLVLGDAYVCEGYIPPPYTGGH